VRTLCTCALDFPVVPQSSDALLEVCLLGMMCKCELACSYFMSSGLGY
jgi:hypothetical protein